jgi:hypothetical protein
MRFLNHFVFLVFLLMFSLAVAGFTFPLLKAIFSPFFAVFILGMVLIIFCVASYRSFIFWIAREKEKENVFLRNSFVFFWLTGGLRSKKSRLRCYEYYESIKRKLNDELEYHRAIQDWEPGEPFPQQKVQGEVAPKEAISCKKVGGARS